MSAVPYIINSRRVVVATLAGLALSAAPASAAPPPPCGGSAQITDPEGDGHHDNTDVLSAWIAESGNRQQAVIKVELGLWEPVHDDSDQAGFALLYKVGGQIHYVRVTGFKGAPPVYDHGTWSTGGGFVKAGDTTGEVIEGPGGTATIDMPATARGTVLAQPFVLTYDGITGPDAHWVDRAPGGTTPDGTEFGADFVAGSCTPADPGDPGSPGTPQGPAGNPDALTAVTLSAPRRMTGSGRARVTGRITPARAGVAVEITATARRSSARRVTTRADGSFALELPLTETTRLRAAAAGLASQTLTVQMYSRVRVKVRKRANGAVVVTGTTSPKLSGRILWLRSNAVRPSARTTARKGRFRLRFARPVPGRYQAVFIPSGRRAERSTSNTGVIR